MVPTWCHERVQRGVSQYFLVPLRSRRSFSSRMDRDRGKHLSRRPQRQDFRHENGFRLPRAARFGWDRSSFRNAISRRRFRHALDLDQLLFSELFFDRLPALTSPRTPISSMRSYKRIPEVSLTEFVQPPRTDMDFHGPFKLGYRHPDRFSNRNEHTTETSST